MTTNSPAPHEPHPSLDVHEVDPARLARGEWSHEHNRTLGEGDISKSYSADRVGMGEPVRAPFIHNGEQWICVGFRYGPVPIATAYRLVHPTRFDGTITSYIAKLAPDGGEAARADPLGFYHGMTVKRGRDVFVLCGPPAEFIDGETQQMSLFE